MNKQGIAVIMFSIVALIAISGCVGQSNQITDANGIIVRDLYTEPANDMIKVGDFISVYFELENVGSSKAKDVVVELSGAGWAPSAMTRYVVGDINPPDPITNSPGGLKPAIFKIPTPVIPEGTTVKYPLKIRVEYNYGSSASVVIPGYSTQRYDRDVQQQKLTKTTVVELPVQQSKLATPIQVIITGPDKIIVPPYPYEEFNYHVTFRNIGDGVPITDNIDGLIYGGLWVTGPGTYFKNCLGVRTDMFSADPMWATPAGVNTIQQLWEFYYQNKNTRASVRYDDNSWGYAFEYVGGGLAVGINSVNAFVRYPTILDWQFLGNYMDAVRLRTGTRSVTRPCTLAIDNAGTGGWESRETDTVTLNFDLRYRYYIEKDFDISVTAPVIKYPGQAG
ncbi:MAG: hypothetical protein HZB65_03255 [Candidatus Aenigmarchaeota archaeon]|nr:hypothetical protein [Candidatus Aenigmarchaeota archaeon]